MSGIEWILTQEDGDSRFNVHRLWSITFGSEIKCRLVPIHGVRRSNISVSTFEVSGVSLAVTNVELLRIIQIAPRIDCFY